MSATVVTIDHRGHEVLIDGRSLASPGGWTPENLKRAARAVRQALSHFSAGAGTREDLPESVREYTRELIARAARQLPPGLYHVRLR